MSAMQPQSTTHHTVTMAQCSRAAVPHMQLRIFRRSPRGYRPFVAVPAAVVQLIMQWLDSRSRAAAAAANRSMLRDAQQSYSWPGQTLVKLRHSQWQHTASLLGKRSNSLLTMAPLSLHLQLYHHRVDVAALLSHLRGGTVWHLQLAICVDPRVGELRLPTARQLRQMLKAAPHLTICIVVLSSFRPTDGAAQREQLAALEAVSRLISVVHSHVYQQA